MARRLIYEREPSPDRQSAGHERWYTYAVTTNLSYRLILTWPVQAADLLPNGETRYTYVPRNDWGQPTSLASTYSAGAAPGVRATFFTYDTSDLPRLVRASGPELDGGGTPLPVRGYAYNSANQITVMTNFVRSGSTWEELVGYGYVNQTNSFGATNRNLISISYPNGLILTNLLQTSTGFVLERNFH